MASLYQNQINIIRGWVDQGNPKETEWSTDYYPFHVVLGAIIDCLEELASRVEIDISSDISALQTHTFGPDIRSDLYNVCAKISAATNKFVVCELTKIKIAHYGRDLRDPIADLFIKLGILEDHFDPTTDDDYIFDNGEIIYYKGTKKNIVIPSTLGEDPTTSILSTGFGGTDIETIMIPEGVTTIE